MLRALDAAPEPVAFFVRDDDAGWDDAALYRLLDLMLARGVPIDLAAIPQAVSQRLTDELMARQDACPALIGIHQHGFAHLNHEVSGRRCEFGTARAWSWQCADLMAGRALLTARFGDRLDPLFTPPWNRCSADTPRLLADLGFAALSRSRGAPVQTELPELPVDVDWSRHEREAQVVGRHDTVDRVAQALALRVQAGGPVGLMLHHAVMGDDSLRQLDQLLRAVRGHARASCQRMTEILGLLGEGRPSVDGAAQPCVLNA